MNFLIYYDLFVNWTDNLSIIKNKHYLYSYAFMTLWMKGNTPGYNGISWNSSCHRILVKYLAHLLREDFNKKKVMEYWREGVYSIFMTSSGKKNFYPWTNQDAQNGLNYPERWRLQFPFIGGSENKLFFKVLVKLGDS